MESFISGSSSSSSSSRPIHVYLSFKGDDETCSFTDRLWAALESNDLNTFWDDKKLEPSDTVFLTHHFLKAIRQSNISIVVFSKTYASSVWCLEELFEIASRIHKPRYTVFPIFYGVDPSEVQNQSNVSKIAFAEHEQRFAAHLHKVQSWRLAMKQVANLSGWDVPSNSGPQVIDDMVREVKRKMRELIYADVDLVGVQSQVKEVEKLLDLGTNDSVRVVGICGMGGIGKTTLARVLYDKISHFFYASHFLVYGDEFDMSSTLVHGKNILLVLDDDFAIYEVQIPLILAIKASLLGGGSRIIITTRDERLLHVFEGHRIYRVKLLTQDEALQLFCKKAFKCYFPTRGYEEKINCVLKYANGLPLSIVELGSYWYNRRPSTWDMIELEKVVNYIIMKVLKRSFDELKSIWKEAFLDIACFFIGKEIKFVEGILQSCGFLGVQLLVEKSLITIIDQKIQMHSLLQKMGRDIVRHEFPSKPEEWSR